MDNLYRKCLIVYNPMSGKGISDDIIEKYKIILEENGYEVDLLPTQYSNHAFDALQETGNYDIVFSIGGDGTLNEVVSGNFKRDEELTICPLPSGTCNDVSTMLGFGNDPIENLNMALTGEVNEMDIATINDKPFVYVACIGKFTNIPYETSSERKRKEGYIAYMKNIIPEIISGLQTYEAEVTVDGVKLDDSYSIIMFSNSNHIAGIGNFYKDISLDDGAMEVLLCKSETRIELLREFIKFIMGIESDDLISLKAHEVSVKLLDKPEKNWCVDGEELVSDTDEYQVEVKNKMKFLTPTKNANQLFKNGKNRI